MHLKQTIKGVEYIIHINKNYGICDLSHRRELLTKYIGQDYRLVSEKVFREMSTSNIN